MCIRDRFQALAQLRAIEASRWLVSAANSGPSLVVRPDGGLGASLAPMQPGTLLVRLQLRSGGTLYGRLGEWPLVLVAAGGIAASRSRVRQS